MTIPENRAARQAAAQFITACADYRALLASQGLPLVVDLTQLEKCCSTQPERLYDLTLALTKVEIHYLLSVKQWPEGLPRLSLPELAKRYNLDYGRMLNDYTS